MGSLGFSMERTGRYRYKERYHRPDSYASCQPEETFQPTIA